MSTKKAFEFLEKCSADEQIQHEFEEAMAGREGPAAVAIKTGQAEVVARGCRLM